MAKKTGKLVEQLRTDVQALSEAVWALKEQMRKELAAEAAANGAKHAKQARSPKPAFDAGNGTSRGIASTTGAWMLHDREGIPTTVRWQQDEIEVQSLIPADPELAATTVSAIGHRQRLAILLSLLQQPASVGELVERLDLGTTGAAYHHLNVLQGAGFVMQVERGVYGIEPGRVGAIVGILAALATESSIVIDDKPETKAG